MLYYGLYHATLCNFLPTFLLYAKQQGAGDDAASTRATSTSRTSRMQQETAKAKGTGTEMDEDNMEMEMGATDECWNKGKAMDTDEGEDMDTIAVDEDDDEGDDSEETSSSRRGQKIGRGAENSQAHKRKAKGRETSVTKWTLYKVPELKAELAKRKLKVGGKKELKQLVFINY